TKARQATAVPRKVRELREKRPRERLDGALAATAAMELAAMVEQSEAGRDLRIRGLPASV
ncbi:MAG: hypothetical protein WA829_00660, partial [Candidatus Acidiferrum sp.]